jgi:hypothetical protein
MITFDLLCTTGHRFEGWFASSDEYARQLEMGLLVCPNCGDQTISKAVTAPFIGRKSNQAPVKTPALTSPSEPASSVASTGEAPSAVITQPPAMPAELVEKLAAMQNEMLKSSDYVGANFVETARAIHYGEAEQRVIHGEATPDQAIEMHEEGISVMPLPFPVIAPKQKN